MSKAAVILGSLFFTALMYCIPVLLTCAILLGWSVFFKYLFGISAILQFAVSVILACASAIDEDHEKRRNEK